MTVRIGLIAESSGDGIESDGRIVRTYTRAYLVFFPGVARQNEFSIYAAVGIQIGSPYSYNAAATCESRTIGPAPEPTRYPYLCYTVTYHWSTKAPFPSTLTDDPTLCRTVWSLQPSIQTQYIVRDRLGVMVLNAAGAPFDGGIPVDFRFGTAVARRYTPAIGYLSSTALANSGKLNSTSYLGGAPLTVQLDSTATERYEGAYHFWEEVHTFSYNPNGWQPKPMNAGFFQKVGGVLKRIRNKDVDPATDVAPDDPVQEPEPLLTTGAIVPKASRPGSCNFITVDAYDSFDFTSLGL